jgi:hAT family C-terminal dimerisation region
LEFFKIRNKPLAHLISTRLYLLESYLQSGAIQPPISNEMRNKFDFMDVDQSLFLTMFREAFQLALNKFKKHVDHHPALSLFKAIQCFDPQYMQANQERHNIQRYREIIEFKNPSNVVLYEWGIYCRLYETFEEEDELDLDVYWKNKKKNLPNLSKIALTYIWLPISGVDVERSFSVYKNILSDKWHALSKESIVALNFLYFNSSNN